MNDTAKTYRTIDHHKCDGQADPITITADERDRDAGNASHHYVLSYEMRDQHADTHLDNDGTQYKVTANLLVDFQHGPVNEVGVNGITNEALLAIVVDRLSGFQTGHFPCAENDRALQHVSVALAALHSRTRARRERNVEGTSQR